VDLVLPVDSYEYSNELPVSVKSGFFLLAQRTVLRGGS
jgi:hypothetical protein